MTFFQYFTSLNWAEIWLVSRSFLFFFLAFFCFSSLRKFLWKQLVPWTERISLDWGNELLETAEGPARLSVFLASLAVSLLGTPEIYYLHSLIQYSVKAISILILVWILDRMLVIFLKHQQVYPRLNLSARSLLLTILRIVTLSLGLLILLDSLGIAITPLLASFSVGTVAVSLALQETLGNFFSGIYLLVDQPIRVGDFVRIEEGNVEGQVKKIGWRSTQILLLANNTVILPNSRLSNSQVVNFDLPDSEMCLYIYLKISLKNDLQEVEDLTRQVAKKVLKETAGAIAYFEPTIRFIEIVDAHIKTLVILRARSYMDHFLLRHVFLRSIQEEFKNKKIAFGLPQNVLSAEGSILPILEMPLMKGEHAPPQVEQLKGSS